MAFDRSAIAIGRSIQDFGLCDLKGVYHHSSRLRSKGFLVVAFLTPLDPISSSTGRTLEQWTALGNTVAIAAIGPGERSELEQWAQEIGVSYPILWDVDSYTTLVWGVSATPTVFVVNGQGTVIAKVIGDDAGALNSAKSLLAAEIAKAEAAAKAAADAKAKAAA